MYSDELADFETPLAQNPVSNMSRVVDSDYVYFPEIVNKRSRVISHCYLKYMYDFPVVFFYLRVTICLQLIKKNS